MSDAYYGTGYDLAYCDEAFWSAGSKFTSPNHLVVISHTGDHGASWTRHILSSGTTNRYMRVLAVDPSNASRVFGLAFENSLWRTYWTTNGGSTWQNQSATGLSGTPCRLVVNPGNGNHLAAATSVGLFSSPDGGATWTRVTTLFGNTTDVIASHDGGSLLASTATQGIWKWDGWTGTPIQICSDPAAVNNLIDGPNLYLYAGSAETAVWRSFYGTGLEESSPGIDPGFSLRVFPNPASGGLATVNFTLPVPGGANLSVYDLSGRLVESMSSPGLEAGEHSWSLSTEGLSPGVYLARLVQRGSVSAARLVVTR